MVAASRSGSQAPSSPSLAAPVHIAPSAPRHPWLATQAAAGVPASLVYPTTTLSRLLDQSADRFGDAIAMVYQQRKWTYGELLSDVNRIAAGLRSGGVRCAIAC